MSKYVRQEKSQRKHPIISSATSVIKAPVVPIAPKERPGWKGPGFTKKVAKAPPRSISPTASARTGPNVQQNLLPFELQQLLLNIFRTTFPICQDYEGLKPTLKAIHIAISNKDFEQAFGRLDWMEAYSVRWSPSKSLCCAAVLDEIFHEFGEELWIKNLFWREESNVELNCQTSGQYTFLPRAVCYGVGPADLMAFGAVLRKFASQSGSEMQRDPATLFELPAPMLDVQIINPSNWSPVIDSLQAGLTTEPVLSKYASASARAHNAPFISPSLFTNSFQKCNILEASQEDFSVMIGKEATLITLFFTVSDLIALSVPKCTALLLNLTLAAPKDSLLLIIDKLDSSAEITLKKDEEGKERKKYPMHYLLDLVLLEKQVPSLMDRTPGWEKLVEDQSRLFKVATELKYPLTLENIKFQMHFFRKV